MTRLSGWCSAAFGMKPDQHHDGCRWAGCQCPNHLENKANLPDSGGVVRENIDGPDGALTPLPGPNPRYNSTEPRSEG